MHLYAGRAHVLPRTRSAVVADRADVDLVAARVGEGDHLEVGVRVTGRGRLRVRVRGRG